MNHKVRGREETPLMYAVEEASLELVEFFIASGADVHAKSIHDYTALDFAMYIREDLMEVEEDNSISFDEEIEKIISLLVGEGAEVNENLWKRSSEEEKVRKKVRKKVRDLCRDLVTNPGNRGYCYDLSYNTVKLALEAKNSIEDANFEQLDPAYVFNYIYITDWDFFMGAKDLFTSEFINLVEWMKKVELISTTGDCNNILPFIDQVGLEVGGKIYPLFEECVWKVVGSKKFPLDPVLKQ